MDKPKPKKKARAKKVPSKLDPNTPVIIIKIVEGVEKDFHTTAEKAEAYLKDPRFKKKGVDSPPKES